MKPTERFKVQRFCATCHEPTGFVGEIGIEVFIEHSDHKGDICQGSGQPALRPLLRAEGAKGDVNA